MADVKLSGIGIVAINGSVGSRTFARNYYGTYVKARSGAPAGSAFLTTWQAAIATLSSGWISLMTDSDRSEWYKVHRYRFDSLGHKIKITGYDLYMMVNTGLIQFGISAVLSPPVLSSALPLAGQEIVTLSASVFTVRVTSPNTYGYLLYVTPSLSPGKMSFNQIYAFLGGWYTNAVPNSIFLQYSARIATPVSGKKIFLKFVPIDLVSGMRGVPCYAVGIVP